MTAFWTMNPMTRNICIYFSDTGGGHRSAADAVEAGIRELLARCPDASDVNIIKETIAEKSHPVNRKFVELYNYLLRHHQPLMKYYYWFIHLIRPDSALNLRLSGPYLFQLLEKQAPSVVVSVHPMLNHCLAKVMEVNGMAASVPLVTVVTDPNADLWRAWACNDVTWFAAPNDVVKEKLTGWGVDPDKIEITGMAVNPSFLKPSKTNRQEFISHLGLSPDVLTVCINAGWAGGGNMLKIYKALSKVKRQLQVIFLCGHNNKLYEQAMAAAAESEVATAVLPFHDSMPDLMASVDMMITKGGGLTTFEAIGRRLPIAFDMITDPMPQERGTIDMMIAQGLAKGIREPHDVISVIEEFKVPADRSEVALPKEHNYDLTDTAVYRIAEQILNLCGVTVPEPEVVELHEQQEPIYVKVS
jgi:processive 1,2-diacylglycerol beta-glucosyltransferase